MIRKVDYPILRAFLHRESKMYNWSRTGEKGRQAFVRRMFKELTRPCKGFNYVHIVSHTNMGCVDSVLQLTASPWVWKNGDLRASLPSSPTSGVSFSERIKDENT